MANPQEDDLDIALDAAVKLMAGARFAAIACATSDTDAARRVTEVADVFVAWLRRTASITLSPPVIEEMEP